jgi:glycosyltransferase involved in cell wall biosynthesis
MKVAIIGPGFGNIPPNGWGAVEIVIWNLKIYLEKLGVDVLIVNLPNENDIINTVNNYEPDIVHIHYDDWGYIADKFICKKVICTNHFAYIEDPNRCKWHFINNFKNSNAIVHCLSQGIYNVFKNAHIPESRLFILPNGAEEEKFTFSLNPLFSDRSIYLAKIDWRKRQFVYQSLPFIDFVGNYADHNFNKNNSNYLGEWSKDVIYGNLTNYANLVLLSDGEAHPLVCCEALNAGLGLVVSTYAAANLDISKPFITVIPNDKLHDLNYVSNAILENQKISIRMREEIRTYGYANFSWVNIIKKYYDFICRL